MLLLVTLQNKRKVVRIFYVLKHHLVLYTAMHIVTFLFNWGNNFEYRFIWTITDSSSVTDSWTVTGIWTVTDNLTVPNNWNVTDIWNFTDSWTVIDSCPVTGMLLIPVNPYFLYQCSKVY